jgi:hypothetical protein
MREGLYKAEYETLNDIGHGLVVLRDGRVYGGDPMIYYVGTYNLDGDVLTARVKAEPYAEPSHGFESIFGREKNTVKLEGTVGKDDSISLEGRSDQVSGIGLTVRLSWLAD